MRIKCVAPKCIGNAFSHSLTTYPFPKITYNKVNQSQPNLVSLRRINLWKKACNLPDDYDIEATEPRICYRHFEKKKPAKKMEMNDVDWVPSLNLNGESDVDEIEQINYEQENTIMLNDQERSESGGIVSFVDLEDEIENQELCTMVYDQETGDVVFVEPERTKDEFEDQETNETKQMTLESTKTPRKRKDDLRKTLSDKKKPKILNRDAPKESDEEPETVTTVVSHHQHQSCQTDLTMEHINEMEMFWDENCPTLRLRKRSRKQKL